LGFRVQGIIKRLWLRMQERFQVKSSDKSQNLEFREFAIFREVPSTSSNGFRDLFMDHAKARFLP